MDANSNESGGVPHYFTWRTLLAQNEEISRRMSPTPRPPAPPREPTIVVHAAPAAGGGLRWITHLVEDALEAGVAVGLAVVASCSALLGSLLPWCAVAVCFHAVIARLAGRALGDVLR